MRIGDVVIPIPEVSVLRCGSGSYTHAICVSVDPFVLVSEETDMLWSATVQVSGYRALCQAHLDIVARCMERARRDGKIA